MSFGAVIGGVATLAGGALAAKSAKKSAKQAAKTAEGLKTELGPATINGPGGASASILANGAGGSINLGDMQGIRDALRSFGQNGIAAASSMGGLPVGVQQALRGVRGAAGLPGMPNTMGLQGALDSTLGRSMFDMNRGSVAPGLPNQLFSGASNQLGQAAQGFGDVRDQTLATLRAQAQPFEQRQMDDLQNNLFSTGRLGSSGGGLMMEAFARGLGQADTDRQLQANNEARLTQQNALGIGQGLAGVGQNIVGLDDNLLQSAFGRFAQTAGLSQGLQQERFGNSMLLNNTGYDRAQNNLQNQISLAGLPTALQGQQLQLGLQGMSAAQGIDQAGMANFQQALAAAQAGANARIGAGSNMVGMANIQAQMPSSGDMWANVLTGLGSRIMPQNNGNGILSGLFGGAPKTIPQPPVAMNYGQQAAWAGG